MPRPSKPLLSRRGIAVEALALVDEEGIEGLTTRKLARRLGVEGPSLYNHVAGREALLDEMTALIDEQVDTSLLDDPGLAGRAPRVRAVLPAGLRRPPAHRRHRHARPVNTDTALRAYDHAFAAFERFGWDGHTASVVMAAIDFLVLGSAIETFKGGFDRPAAEYDPDYPHLAARCAPPATTTSTPRLRARARGPRRVAQRTRTLNALRRPERERVRAIRADPGPHRERRALGPEREAVAVAERALARWTAPSGTCARGRARTPAARRPCRWRARSRAQPAAEAHPLSRSGSSAASRQRHRRPDRHLERLRAGVGELPGDARGEAQRAATGRPARDT